MNKIIISTAVALAFATPAAAGSVSINSHDGCVEYNGNLTNSTVSINRNAERGYVVDTSTGRNCSNRNAPNSNTGSSGPSQKAIDAYNLASDAWNKAGTNFSNISTNTSRITALENISPQKRR